MKTKKLDLAMAALITSTPQMAQIFTNHFAYAQTTQATPPHQISESLYLSNQIFSAHAGFNGLKVEFLLGLVVKKNTINIAHCASPVDLYETFQFVALDPMTKKVIPSRSQNFFGNLKAGEVILNKSESVMCGNYGKLLVNQDGSILVHNVNPNSYSAFNDNAFNKIYISLLKNPTPSELYSNFIEFVIPAGVTLNKFQ